VRALLLPIGDEFYAVPLASVRQIIERPPATRLPTAPPALIGLINVHGEVIPLLDTAALLDRAGMAAAAFAVVVDGRSGAAALATTAMPSAVELGDAVGEAVTPGAIGTYVCAGRLAVLLDPERILAGEGTRR
jgi:purine-binding chemotaxis protein CheW